MVGGSKNESIVFYGWRRWFLRKPSNLPQKKTMLVKTLLNKVERFKSFVCGSIHIMLVGGTEALTIDIEPRHNSKPICPECRKGNTVYDRQPQRLYEYLPIWSFKAFFRYAPRRVKCPEHCVKVDALPLAYGKAINKKRLMIGDKNES